MIVLPDQLGLDLYAIGKNVDFKTFGSNYVLSFAKNMSIYESWGDIIGRYKRNSLVKILKEKFGNFKTYRYREMLIYRMSIYVDCTVLAIYKSFRIILKS